MQEIGLIDIWRDLYPMPETIVIIQQPIEFIQE